MKGCHLAVLRTAARQTGHRFPFAAWLIALLATLFAPPSAPSARAADLYSYDLSSLCYQSTDILEGQFDGQGKLSGAPVRYVRVRRVFKGQLRPDARIVVTSLDVYRVPVLFPPGRTGPLADGVRAYFFLAPTTEGKYWSPPVSISGFMPVASGVKVEEGDRIAGFVQRDNPGPYVENKPNLWLPGPKSLPTQDEFLAELRIAGRQADAFAAHMAAGPPSSKDGPWLLAALRSDPPDTVDTKLHWRARSVIREEACRRIGAIRDLGLLDQAEAFFAENRAGGFYPRMQLDQGYDSPQGREHLLDEVTNPALSLPVRLRLAGAIRWAGDGFGIEKGSDAGFATRLAKTAVAARSEPTLAEALVGSFDSLTQQLGSAVDSAAGMPRGKDASAAAAAAAQSDRHTALILLASLHADPAMSPLLRYDIDIATRRADPDLARRLYPDIGDIVSHVAIPDDPRGMKQMPGSLVVVFGYTSFLPHHQTAAGHLTLTARDGSGRHYDLPVRYCGQIGMFGESANGGEVATLPPNGVPKGLYHIALTFTEPGGKVSKGEGFDAEL